MHFVLFFSTLKFIYHDVYFPSSISLHARTLVTQSRDYPKSFMHHEKFVVGCAIVRMIR